MQYEVNSLLEAASLILEKTTGDTIVSTNSEGDAPQGGNTIVPSDPTPVGGTAITVYGDYQADLSPKPANPKLDSGPITCRPVSETHLMDFIATRTSGQTLRSQLKCIPIIDGECRQELIFPFPNDGTSSQLTAQIWMNKVSAGGTPEETNEWVIIGYCEFVFESADVDAPLVEFRMHVSADNPAGMPISNEPNKGGVYTFVPPTHMIFHINNTTCLVGHIGQGIFCGETPYHALTMTETSGDSTYCSSVYNSGEWGLTDGDWEEILSVLEANAPKTTLSEWTKTHPTNSYGIGMHKYQEGNDTIRYYVAGWFTYPSWREDANGGYCFSIGNDYIDFGYITTRHVYAGFNGM